MISQVTPVPIGVTHDDSRAEDTNAPMVTLGTEPMTESASPPAEDPALSRIAERMRLHSPALVKETFEIVLRQSQNEVGRQARLDGKATSLLTSSGLSLTVAFSFGGQLLIANAEKLKNLTSGQWWLSAIMFGLSVFLGLAATVCAIWGLKVRDRYLSLSEDAIFNQSELRYADELLPDEPDEKDAYNKIENLRVATYRRYLIPRMWEQAQRASKIQNSKATIISTGQYLFVAFVVITGALIVTMVMQVIGAH